MAKKIRSINIYFKNQKWWLDYRDHESSRRRETFVNKSDAESRKKELELIFSGYLSRPELVHDNVNEEVEPTVLKTIQDALLEYDAIEGAKKKPRTRQNESYAFEALYLFLNNERSRSYIHEVTAQDMSAFQTMLSEQKYRKSESSLKGSTINRKFHAFGDFFSHMVRWGFIAKSPIEGLRSLPEEETQRQVWSDDQIKAYYDQLEPWAKDVTYFLASTGCRPGQASELKWESVDFEDRVLKMKSQKGGRIKSVVLPITDEMVHFLSLKLTEARRSFRAKPHDHVFFNSKGRAMTAQAFARAVKKVSNKLVKVGLVPDGLVPYGLRHTYLTQLVELGVHSRQIQLIAGHSKFETTTRYTGRVKTNVLREAVLAMQTSRKINR